MALKASQCKVGDTYTERVVEDLKRTQLVMYAGASGDYNPLHSDELYTREVAKYPTVFAHGMLTMGMTGRMLTNFVGDGGSPNTACVLQTRYGRAIPWMPRRPSRRFERRAASAISIWWCQPRIRVAWKWSKAVPRP